MKYIREEVVWGILGVGDVCEKKSGPAFSKVPNSVLRAVMRRNLKKAEDYALRHGVSKFSSDVNDLLSDNKINAIYIATPPAFHEEYTLQALEAGKAVYVEKPVSLNVNSCKRMIAAAKKHNRPVSVAHYRRALGLFSEVKKLLSGGVIGKPLFVTIQTLKTPLNDVEAAADLNWRIDPKLSGGGLFYDLAPHQLDLMYWYFGAPENISGYSTNQGSVYLANDYTHLDIRFKNNILLNGTWSFSVHESANAENCTIAGDKGSLSFSFFGKPFLNLQTDAGHQRMEFPVSEHIQQNMIEKVVGYFRGNNENPCSLEDALESMKMIDAAQQKF